MVPIPDGEEVWGIPVDFHARLPLRLLIENVSVDDEMILPGEITFLIHSPSLLFGSPDAQEGLLEFEITRNYRGSETWLSWLCLKGSDTEERPGEIFEKP